MPASQKIITKLRERRQIEADLRGLLTADSDLVLRRQAQEIAALGSQVIPIIVDNLSRADAQMLVAMGVVAAFLDPEEVGEALRQAILQPDCSDQGRIAAMTILERFLGQPVDDGLMASLSDPEGMALSSLEEVLDRASQNPAVLVQYVQGLDRQEPDVVLGLVRALRDIGNQQVVEPLRMMAQDVREEIAAAALDALGTIRLPEAVRALQTLIPASAPALRPRAERLLRKLQFAGVPVEPLSPPPSAWRGFASGMDGQGQQHVWFVEGDGASGYGRFLSILLSDRLGAVEAVGHTQVPLQMLPPHRPLGHVHDVALPDGSGALLMLETSFDLVRRLVREALAYNRETQIPVAGPLRLLSPWLWGYAGSDSLPARTLPDLPEAVFQEDSGASTAELLRHPAFATWTVRSEAVLRAAEEIVQHPGWDIGVWIRRLAGDLFAEPMVVRMFHERLLAMSEWLLLSGDKTAARLALAAAQAILQRPADQPFIEALIRRDLSLAVGAVGWQSEMELGAEKLS